MEDSLARVQSAYTAVVFFAIIPRFILRKAYAERRHVFIMIFVLGIYIANLIVYAVFFPSTKVPAFYAAMLGPFMALWFAIAGQAIDESRKKPKTQSQVTE